MNVFKNIIKGLKEALEYKKDDIIVKTNHITNRELKVKIGEKIAEKYLDKRKCK